MDAVSVDVNLTERAKAPSLWRNKAFNLLWGSQALSGLGSSMSALATPLLTLYLTGSPIKAGLVGTSYSVVRLAGQLPSGVITDRVDRRRLMLTCDAARLFAFGLLGWAVLTDRITLLWIVATVMVVGLFDAASDTAHFSAIRNVVALQQVPQASAANEARQAAVNLVGPPIGGALYGFARSVPFFADAISFLLSFIGIWFIRRPMQQERTEPREHPVKELIEGVRFTWREPFLRAALFIAPPINLGFNALMFAIIVILQQRGTPPALIGTAEAVISVGVLGGAFAAGWIVRKVPLRRLLVMATWTAVVVVAAGSLLTSSILISVPMAIAIAFGPGLNSALFGYQAAVTPDRLQGRVMSVIITLAMGLASMASLVGGVLVHWLGGPGTVLAAAGIISISALAATFSKGMRTMRPLSEMEAPA
ncbi:MAG TPA: MFS transporter [Candidatus Limnocylindrales bacterium]|nr:MFS transporter [Candidatus Limnocylindrales bacterium]